MGRNSLMCDKLFLKIVSEKNSEKCSLWLEKLDECDLWVLRLHCIKNITACAEEHFQKSLSETTLCDSQRQVKALSYKQEAMNEHNPLKSPSSLSQS